ncbi:MAG: FlgD immunoglobulin-like domain containing protein [Candidatus Gracilibacteria bacterium]|jgi:flagellar hook assembly protein FlgD
MLKKILSGLCAILVVAMSMPSVFALVPVQKNLVYQISLTVDDEDLYYFEPSKGKILNVKVILDSTNFLAELSSSSGVVELIKDNKVIKTLYPSWDLTKSGTLELLTTALGSLTWDGKSIDDTADAKSVCGTAGAVCPDGDYNVRVYVGTPKYYDDSVRYFGVYPNIYIKTIAASLYTFDPYTQTSDISFTLVGDGYVTLRVGEWGSTGFVSKKTILDNCLLTAGNYLKTTPAIVTPPCAFTGLAWDGKDSSGNVLPNKEYDVMATTRKTPTGEELDNRGFSIVVNAPATSALSFTTPYAVVSTLNDVTTSTPTVFDPSTSGKHEILKASYGLSAAADSVQVEIKNSLNTVVKTFTASTTAEKTSGIFQWDGKYSGRLVEPGVYTASFTAKKAGMSPDLTSSKDITVTYSDSNRPILDNVSVSLATFDPDFESSTISFRNTKSANITFQIRNSAGTAIRTYSDYDYDGPFSENQNNSVAWNGKDNSDTYVAVGTYKAVIIATNEYGVVTESKDIAVNNSKGSASSSNAHIDDVSVSPSSKFQPADDEELKVQFDVDVDLDSLKITATGPTTSVELYNESSIDQESNLEITWDGTDDNGDYVDAGDWNITFESKKGTTILTAVKSITVEYDKPEISDLYISKDKIDNEMGETTNVLFRLKDDAKVDLVVMEGASEDDTIEEDMEIVKNTWYAVEWDGGSYDYNDTVSVKLVAKNLVNDSVYDSEKITVDLAEDTDSSSKSNVTNDFISPVVTNGTSEMTLGFDLEDTADVTVTIHKGKSSTGSVVATLLDNVQDMQGGHQELLWNGKDKNGNTLSKDYYTYKIVSKDKSTETETGMFIVGTVGNISSGSSSSGSSSSSSGVNSNVTIVTGGNTEPVVTPVTPIEPTPTPVVTTKDCGGFSDVNSTNQYCDAIDWAYENGVFSGYSDGSFKPFQTINRVELLKVVVEAFGLSLEADDGTTLGFKDVVKGSWYMKYIRTAKNKSIFSGDSGKGTARPDAVINRAEALKFIFETAKAAGRSFSPNGSNYSDVKAGVWYEAYAALARKLGLFDGTNLYPSNLMSRGEVAQVLYRIMK